MLADKLHSILFEGFDNQLYIDDMTADKLGTAPGWFELDLQTGDWLSANGETISNVVRQYLDQQLTASQKYQIQRAKMSRKGRDLYGTYEDPDLETNQGDLLPWEVEYLKVLKGFVEDNEVNGKALPVMEAGLEVPEFALPDDLYMVLDPGGDYVVITSGRTRKNKRTWSHGNGTYIFRKVAPAAINDGGLVIEAGEPYTDYVEKLKLGESRKAGTKRAEKLLMRDYAKEYNLGIMLRRDKHYRHIEDLLKPGTTFDEIREHMKD